LKATLLDNVYKDERDTDVKERILLVRRILTDKQHIESVAQENYINQEHGPTNGTKDTMIKDWTD